VETYRKNKHDKVLFILVLALALFGFFMEASASFIYAGEKFGSNFFFIKKHVFFFLLGFFFLVFFSYVNYSFFKKLNLFIYIVTVVLLIMTLIPGLGTIANGSRRWLFGFQTSELAKFTTVVFLANYYSKKEKLEEDFKELILKPLLVCSILWVLVLLQPDYSTTMFLGILSLAMIFVAGVRLKYFLLPFLAFVSIAALALVIAPYRMKRFLAFLDYYNSPRGSGFQVIQSLMGVYGGGFLGRGIGAGRQKLFYLPESHNDFIFSVISEELGLWGVAILLTLFLFIVLRSFRISVKSKDDFGRYFSFGIICIFSLQFILNIFVALGLFPVTGLTLPFVSYGGASLILLMSLTGVLLNISKKID
jgi:cell division protein FtsW